MLSMNTEHIIQRYPRLYHMAERDSWPNIQEYGLLSTSALLDLYNYEGERRQQLECEWRADRVTLKCEGLPDAALRDQKPMPPKSLVSCLEDVSPGEWYKIINEKSFFWVEWSPSVEWFIGGREYRNKTHLIITVNTESLISSYYDQISLSGINSGSTYFNAERLTGPKTRGLTTFKRIPDFDMRWVTELTVDYGVPDILNHAVSVEYWVSRNRVCTCMGKIWP